MLTKGATAVRMPAPNMSIQRKSALRLRNDPSSSDLLYLTRKNMWKKKSRPVGQLGGRADGRVGFQGGGGPKVVTAGTAQVASGGGRADGRLPGSRPSRHGW